MYKKLNNKTVAKVTFTLATVLLVVQIIYVTAVYYVLVKSGIEVSYIQMWLSYFKMPEGITAMLVTILSYIFAIMRSKLQ